jgi:GcrA cell cycle regulator
MAWTNEKIELLKKLWDEGLTASRIAHEIGDMTRNAVIGKAHRLGLSGRMQSKSKNSSISIVRKKKNSSYNKKIIEISTQVDEPMNPTLFLDIRDGMCRWPLGEPGDSDFKFCGRSTNEKVYCKHHHKMAFQPLTSIRNRKKINKKFRIA